MIKKIKIQDIGKIITGNTPPRSNPELYGTFIPFIKATDIIESSKFTYYPEEGYSELGFQKYQNSLICKGATCVVTIGSVGKKLTMAHCDCFINQAMNAVIPNDNYDDEYIYYLLKNNIYKLKMLNSGTASGRENISKSAFSNMEIEVILDKEKQIIIGKILSTYDDLIENNKKQIKLLEEAAQRLYKEWFVDLHFPGYETTPIIDGVPEGWTKKSVENSLEMYIGGGWGKEIPTGNNVIAGKVIRGTDINDIKAGNFKDVPLRYHTKNDINKRNLQKYDIVFELSNGNINNIGRSILIDDFILEKCGENTICASFCKLFRPLDKVHSLILYCEIQDMQNSGRMLPFKKQGSNGINNFAFEEFLNHEFLVPNVEKFIKPIDNIINLISVLQNQVSELIEARDRLLPKLMNGELEV